MYYEIHGEGSPLLLLHGAYMTADTLGPLLPGLAETRQVIAPEQQGHGRTADIDRPITYEQMADDTAELVRHLGHEQLDIVGYSMGGGVMGDLSGLPQSQLAVLPGTSHYVPPGSGILDRADWLLPMIRSFPD